MAKPDVDYDGQLSRRYEQGRSLHADAVATWRQAIEAYLPEKGLIVDVGAGTGRFARELDTMASGRVLAIEPASGMRASAPRSDPSQVTWIGGAAESLPLADASVAMVWSAFTAHYLDLEASAAEFARVLKPGGWAVIWHVFPDVFDDVEWFRWFPTARLLDEVRMPSEGVVTGAFTKAGFELPERTDHRMRIADNLGGLGDRLAHRSISTLTLISDDEFADGMSSLRSEAGQPGHDEVVVAPNVMLAFTAR